MWFYRVARSYSPFALLVLHILSDPTPFFYSVIYIHTCIYPVHALYVFRWNCSLLKNRHVGSLRYIFLYNLFRYSGAVCMRWCTAVWGEPSATLSTDTGNWHWKHCRTQGMSSILVRDWYTDCSFLSKYLYSLLCFIPIFYMVCGKTWGGEEWGYQCPYMQCIYMQIFYMYLTL